MKRPALRPFPWRFDVSLAAIAVRCDAVAAEVRTLRRARQAGLANAHRGLAGAVHRDLRPFVGHPQWPLFVVRLRMVLARVEP